AAFFLVRHQTNLIYTQSSHLINRVNYIAVVNPYSALDVDNLVLFLLDVSQHLFNFVFELLFGDQILAQVILAILRDGNHDRIVLNDSLIFLWIIKILRQVYSDAVLQHGCYDHEDDQQDQHDIDHRGDVNLRLKTTTAARCHSHNKLLSPTATNASRLNNPLVGHAKSHQR